jgi:hypothetical protein
MHRTFLTALASLPLLSACVASADPLGDPGTSSSEALESPSVPPTFLAEGVTVCADVPGAGGAWSARSGQFSVCRVVSVTLSGCGYAWSSPLGAPPDVDALAASSITGANRLRKLEGKVVVGATNACGHNHSPGSTPCGACQVGVATSTHLYLWLDEPYAKETDVTLTTSAPSTPSLVVSVPANQTSLTKTVALPSDFAGGASLWPADSFEP